MVGVGVVGLGRIAVYKHIPDILSSVGGRVTAICDIDKAALNRAGDKLNIDASHRFERYEDMVLCKDVDAVDICTPNYMHCPIALFAVRAGKPVNVEKPLGVSLEDTLALQAAMRETDTPGMMCFSYRFMKAVRYAKEILDQGLISEILNINVAYLQSGALIPGRRLEWRFDRAKAGSGALGDLGAHLIDMAILLLGDIKGVSARMGTVVKRRKQLTCEEYADVTVDDYCNFIAEFSSGASGVFNISKCAIGHSNTIRFEIFGRDGVISFNLNQPDTLDICIGKIDVECSGLHTVTVPERYSACQGHAFIDMVMGKQTPLLPTISDGVNCQRVLDAVMLSAESEAVVRL